MILAAAQTQAHRHHITANLEEHYRFAEMAADQGAGLILFPEMSLTGYEREDAAALAFSEDDPRLTDLRQLAVQRQITVIAGAPVFMQDKLHIGAFILQADGNNLIYTKQFLHEGEELFFQPSNLYNPVLVTEAGRCTLAICADIDHPEHAAQAAARPTSIYLASIFFTPGGIPEAHRLLTTYARKHQMNVLMANYCGTSWGLAAGGQSAFWNAEGERVDQLDAHSPGLLLAERVGEEWSTKKISL